MDLSGSGCSDKWAVVNTDTTFKSHKMWRTFWLAEDLLAPEEGLSS